MISTATRSDFGDWLSPMLVKELRQGMRSKVFMSAFYLAQLLMILTVIFNLTAAASSEVSMTMQNFLNGLFWFMISVPLLFLMPLRGFGALHGELKAGTLELVFLTRLSAWRIAAGKWTALMVQTLLLVCSVLPYVLLRYFLGGVNVIEDVQSLFFLLVASGTLTAATIAISPYESRLLRALFVAGMLVGLLVLLWSFAMWMAYAAMSGASTSATLVPWLAYVGIAIFIPAFVVLALEIAASRIAPAAENHAIRKRLLGLYFPLAAGLLTLLGAHGVAMFNLAAVFVAIVCIDALAEPHDLIPSAARGFFRRGLPGRLLALFFTPGWVSAAWYILLLVFIAGGLLMFAGIVEEPRHVLHAISFLGWIIFPAALLRLFTPDTKHFLGFYIAIQFLLTAVTCLVAMMSGIADRPLVVWLCPLPNCAFLLNIFSGIPDEQVTEFLAVTGAVTIAALAILLARTITPLRRMRSELVRQPQ